MENYERRTTSADDMLLTNESRFFLKEISKWARFLSVVGIVIIGFSAFMLVVGSISLSYVNHLYIGQNIPGISAIYNPGVFKWIYIIIYLLILGVYFIPVYFLYKFSVITKRALDEGNSLNLSDGFRNLKNHYLFMGVLTIILLAFFALSIILMIAGLR